jgi:hypothetical protein
MNGLAAFRYVLAGSSYSVAACEESGTGDQKQSNESCHISPMGEILDVGSGADTRSAWMSWAHRERPRQACVSLLPSKTWARGDVGTTRQSALPSCMTGHTIPLPSADHPRQRSSPANTSISFCLSSVKNGRMPTAYGKWEAASGVSGDASAFRNNQNINFCI